MPYSFDLLDQEQKKKEQGQEDGAAPAMTGGGETFVGGTGGQTPSTAPAEKGTSKQGSGFVNLDKYMAANKGNQFGSQFTGKVQNDVGAAKQSLDKSTQDFTQASNQGTTRWNDVQGDVQGIVDQAGDNTSKDDVAKVKSLSSAQYQGPENFLGSAYGTQAQGAVQKASQQAKALQSEGGRFALLDQFYGRPKYSMGEKSLDNLLVQNTPGVAARAQSIGSQAKQLGGQSAQTARDMDNLAVANKAATQDAAKQTGDYVRKSLGDFGTGLQKRVSDYNTQRDQDYARLAGDIEDDRETTGIDAGYDAQTLQDLGLSDGQSIMNLDVGRYLSQNPNASAATLASDEDYARYLALAEMANEDPSLLLASDRSKAGTAAEKGYSFDKEGFQRDLNNARNEFNARAFPLMNQMNAISEAKRTGNWTNPAIYDGPVPIGQGSNVDQAFAQLAEQYNAMQELYRPGRMIKRKG